MAAGNRILLAICALGALIAGEGAAAAAQISIAWDANAEANIAGYVVQWGPVSAPFSNSVDVGNTTTWTLTSATEGMTYSFRVVAYNTLGEYSDPSLTVSATPAITPTSTPTPAPTLSLGRSALNFGVLRSGTVVVRQTGAQSVTVSQSGTGAFSWSVSASQPWVKVSPASGTGNGGFTVSIDAALAPASGTADATIAVTSAQAGNASLAVHLVQVPASAPPTGAFDTPLNDAANISGAIAVTGWALDDVEVNRVELWRDAIGGEPAAANGKVFIGNAVFVAGARSDIETLAPAAPFNYRAGWGYLLLTNGLPNSGNGTFTLYAYAIDVEGYQALLGSKTITAANATATAPFGTLDTPAQGQTIGGNAYVSFGWALSPHSQIPVDGSTIDVYVDGVNVGHPKYNNYRTDIATAFPGYANSDGAVGYFVLDTTTLANGVHTIGWIARDSAGNSQGLGSRFFVVVNGTAPAGVQAAQSATAVADVPPAYETIEVRRAAAPESASLAIPEYTGRLTVRVTELEVIELRLASRFGFDGSGTYEGFVAVGGELRALPAGSTLDPAQGIFRWQTGPAFVGSYDLIFVRTDASGAKTKIPVRVEIAGGSFIANR